MIFVYYGLPLKVMDTRVSKQILYCQRSDEILSLGSLLLSDPAYLVFLQKMVFLCI